MRGVGVGVGLALVAAAHTGFFVNFVGQTGNLALPTGATFACASTTSVQTSASTLQLGVAANQAVGKWTAKGGGLQMDCQSQNIAFYSSKFANWSGAPTSTTIRDPAGTNTGCDVTISGIYTGGFSGLATNVTALTVSAWSQGADGTSKTAIGAATPPVAPLVTVLEPSVVPTPWHRVTGTYTGAAVTANYLLINDTRLTGLTAPARGQYAFTQLEVLPFSTAYIDVPGTSAVTRLPSILTAALPNDSDLIFDLEFEANRSTKTAIPGEALAALVSTGPGVAGNTVAWDYATGKVRLYWNGTYDGNVVLSWVAGDIVRFIITFNSSANTISYVCYVNAVVIADETLNIPTNPTFGILKACLFCNYAGSQHTSPAAVRHIGIKPRPRAATQLADIGTLLAAWDARQGIAKTGALVDSWTPYAGDASIVLSAAGAARPTWVADRGDGRPELSFDGSANWMLSSAANLANIVQTGCGVVFVGTRPTNVAGHVGALNGSATLDRMFNVYYNSGTLCSNQVYTPAGDSGTYTFNADTKRQAFVFNRSGTVRKEFSSYEALVTAGALSAAALTTALQKFAIGAYVDGTQPGAIKLSAIFLFSTPINTGAEIKAALLATSQQFYPVL